jgi:hypothetical protein
MLVYDHVIYNYLIVQAARITPKQAMEHEYFASIREYKLKNTTPK